MPFKYTWNWNTTKYTQYPNMCNDKNGLFGFKQLNCICPDALRSINVIYAVRMVNLFLSITRKQDSYSVHRTRNIKYIKQRCRISMMRIKTIIYFIYFFFSLKNNETLCLTGQINRLPYFIFLPKDSHKFLLSFVAHK